MKSDPLTIVRAYFDNTIVGDASNVDTYISEDYVSTCKWKDRNGLRKILQDLQSAYPILTWRPIVMVLQGDLVAVHLELRCKRDSDTRTITITAILKVQEGKIVAEWANSNSFF